MRVLSENQQIIMGSTVKNLVWLFKIGTHQWSTQHVSWEGEEYEFKVVAKSFPGIRLNRSKSELAMQTVDAVSFDVVNGDGSLDPDDFPGQRLIISLLVTGYGDPATPDAWGHGDAWGSGDDGWYKPTTPAFQDIIGEWHFNVSDVAANYGVCHFTANDILDTYLDGEYPNTWIPGLNANHAEVGSDCVPVCFGSCYVPLPCISVGGENYYLLGENTGQTYTIEKVRSPQQVQEISVWEAPGYSFPQSVVQFEGKNYCVFQPIIAKGEVGVWRNGDSLSSMPTKYTSSDTVEMTNPADIIAYILKDIGIDPAMIDDGQGGTFPAAAAIYDTWGLEWNFGLWKRTARRKLIPQLLNACNSILRRSNGVFCLHPLKKTSVATLFSSDIIRKTFKTQMATPKQIDVAGFYWQVPDIPQDSLIMGSVSINSNPNPTNYSSETMDLSFVQDSQHAQWLARLYYIRKFYRGANISFTAMGGMSMIEPDDVITISGAIYGGTYDVLVDQIHITADLTVKFYVTKYIIPLQNYKDTTAPVIDITEDVGSGTMDTIITYAAAIKTSALPATPPTNTGLWINESHMGYFETDAWKNFFSNTGEFQFYGDEDHFLSFDGSTWILRSDPATEDAPGLLPALPGTADTVLKGDGQWQGLNFLDKFRTEKIGFEDQPAIFEPTVSDRGIGYFHSNMFVCDGHLPDTYGLCGYNAETVLRYMPLFWQVRTMSFWFKRLNLVHDEHLIGFHDPISNTPTSHIVISRADNKIKVWSGTGYTAGNAAITDLDWHIMAVRARRMDDGIDIFIDGVMVTPDTSFEWPDQQGGFLRIGYIGAHIGESFTDGSGCFDDLSAFSEYLSDSEIAVLGSM